MWKIVYSGWSTGIIKMVEKLVQNKSLGNIMSYKFVHIYVINSESWTEIPTNVDISVFLKESW